jgi:DNA-binding response OmpR family regulator
MAKILFIDDDPDIVEAGTIVLESAGHQVVAAHDRAAGMAAVKAHNPDLIILDVMMQEPDDGIAMAVDLRKGGFKKPILMLTSLSKVVGYSYGREDDVVPVDEFQEKPIEPSALVAKVNELLAAKER